MAGANAQLPVGVQQQGVTVLKVSTDILLVVSLYSETDKFDPSFLSNYAVINLQNPLARLPGVGQVRVVGAGPYSMRIWLDPNKLRDYRLTTLDVVRAIQSQNVQVVAGQLGGPPVPPEQFSTSLPSMPWAGSKVWRNSKISLLRVPGPGPKRPDCRVRDVARVELSQQSYGTFAAMRGHPAAQVIVYSLPGANALDVANRVRQAMEDMGKNFPEGLDL